MSIEQDRLNIYHGLTTHRWRLYECSDCNPEFADANDPEGAEYAEPYRIICQIGTEPPEHCPRCASYLSLCETTEVDVTAAARR